MRFDKFGVPQFIIDKEILSKPQVLLSKEYESRILVQASAVTGKPPLTKLLGVRSVDGTVSFAIRPVFLSSCCLRLCLPRELTGRAGREWWATAARLDR